MRTLLLLLAFGSTAYAQAPGETPATEAEPSPIETPPAQTKSVWAAYGLTIAATSLPAVIAAAGGGLVPESHERTQDVLGMVGCAGLVFGPSAGHWYVGEGVTTGPPPDPFTMRLRASDSVGPQTTEVGDATTMRWNSGKDAQRGLFVTVAPISPAKSSGLPVPGAVRASGGPKVFPIPEF